MELPAQNFPWAEHEKVPLAAHGQSTAIFASKTMFTAIHIHAQAMSPS